MSLETPRLDDRTFTDLVDEARRRIPLYTPEWTDFNLSDPGITLLELFAWMTDIVLYRLNRVPDKHYIKMMEMIGIRLKEVEAARTAITFWLSAPQPVDVLLPEGVEVSTPRTEMMDAVVFSTDVPMTIYVPKLASALTSFAGRGGGREIKPYNVRRLEGSSESMPAFESKPPQAGDAFYLGFDEDLSFHILGVEIGVEAAEGAGIDPTNPPYVWEAISADGEQEWVPLQVDYDGTLGLNVNGLVRLHLPAITKAMRNNVNGYWVRCRLDPSRSPRSYGVSPVINHLRIESWGITVEATNISRSKNEALGRSEGTPGQKFYLAHTPIVPRLTNEYIVVRQEDGREDRWKEVADFGSSQADDLHYTLDSNSGEIRFGPALPRRDGGVQLLGAVPVKGAQIMMRQYRHGGGAGGNLAVNTMSVLKTSIPYIAKVSNRFPASGGIDAEKLETAKERVPDFLRSLNRAVTTADYEYLAEEAAPGEVARAHCVQAAAGSAGEVRVLIVPRIPNLIGPIAPQSLSLTTDLRDRIAAYLDERRLLGVRLEVSPPAYQWVDVEVRFRAAVGAVAEEVRQRVEDRLYTFLNPITGGQDGKGWAFGRTLYLADIMAVLLPIQGVDFVRAVHIYPVGYINGQFVRGDEIPEVTVPEIATIASYHHDVRVE